MSEIDEMRIRFTSAALMGLASSRLTPAQSAMRASAVAEAMIAEFELRLRARFRGADGDDARKEIAAREPTTNGAIEPRWATVEIMGHRSHVGRVSEVRAFGEAMVGIEMFRLDGSTQHYLYSPKAVFSVLEATEEEARRAAVANMGCFIDDCGAFKPAPVFPTLCADCGHLSEAHTGAKEEPSW